MKHQLFWSKDIISCNFGTQIIVSSILSPQIILVPSFTSNLHEKEKESQSITLKKYMIPLEILDSFHFCSYFSSLYICLIR